MKIWINKYWPEFSVYLLISAFVLMSFFSVKYKKTSSEHYIKMADCSLNTIDAGDGCNICTVRSCKTENANYNAEKYCTMILCNDKKVKSKSFK